MSKLLARTLAERDPNMRGAGRLQGQKTSLLVGLKSEFAVESFGDREIGNSEMKPVDRVNAEFAGTAGWLHGVANGGHDASSRIQCRLQFGDRSNLNAAARGGLPITMGPKRSADALNEIPPASIIDFIMLSPFRRLQRCRYYLDGRG